ncbi:MAG: 3-hydroxybutyryl-CoA dehydrogenase [Alicyclobacillus sp.]|nr:3-hydroxybutyryl-CoA dehydrogenase [Alicyclobacillus sp.]
MDMERVLVAGAGQMGRGIAQVLAEAGYAVVLCDTSQALAERGRALIADQWQRAVARGKLTPDAAAAALARIEPVADLAAAAGCQLAIEAVPEDLTVKKDVFQQLDTYLPADAVLASNTSSLPITQLAAATRRPWQVIGMHFMNPVPVLPLVELVRGLVTADEVYEQARALVLRLGKTPVLVRDVPGFVSNRVLMPLVNEAVWCLYEGVATAADVDRVLTLGMRHPLGPLALADLIGLDTCLAILEVLHQGYGDPKFRPCPLLRQYVQAGWLGRKSGRGFFTYTDGGPAGPSPALARTGQGTGG